MNRIIPLLIVLLVLFTPVAFAQIQISEVVPNSLTNVEGDTQSGLVFDCLTAFRPSMRYQQVYLNSQIVDRPAEIISINFRPTEDQPTLTPMVIPQLQIDMSITQTDPGDLALTFADNLGPVVTTVYDGPYTVAFPSCGNGPCPFDVKVPLQTPFMYDPSQGNLIIDIRVPECIDLGPGVFMDATDFNTSDSSKVFTSNTSVDDPQGDPNFLNDGGFVTQFEMILSPRNVPTLSQWGLIA
ncbi:MAG: hypothetical protein AAF462_11385, partial [Thermodesulfobacteriota bacterium]